ncbi:DUF2190 family protein [Paenirhodobacter enshiensis]|uniref:DUF2190 family protein n=1 Tax=Paenirhodobacter enshiensis TaxID=1105367 RepID=A0A086XQQ6_9RHOB|nr:DUF2190 family protein [Paenirhodobacter enshiensis]KFI24356.1 hypothetical protein CG50_10665 [Paenirhodobacter enshiensis]
MKNYLGPGDTLVIPAPSAVASGGIVVAGSITGIAAAAAAEGEDVVVKTDGKFSVPKPAGETWTVGAPIYATDTAGTGTITAGTNAYLGVAVEAAASADTVGSVRLGGAIPITWGA